MGVWAEHQRIEKVVVHPPVDYVHLPQAVGGAHIDHAVADRQIAPLHQFRADFPRQEHMLVVGGVVDAGRQQGDDGVGLAAGGHSSVSVACSNATYCSTPLHPVATVQAGQADLGRLAIGNHVRDARGHPQVVLQHAEAVVGAHHVAAADGGPCAVGRREVLHFRAVLGTAADHVLGNHAVVNDAGLAVHVFQEVVEGAHPLGQPIGHLTPVGGGHHAGDGVYGDDSLLGLGVPVDGEGDALAGEGAIHTRPLMVSSSSVDIRLRASCKSRACSLGVPSGRNISS